MNGARQETYDKLSIDMNTSQYYILHFRSETIDRDSANFNQQQHLPALEQDTDSVLYSKLRRHI